MLSPFYLKKLGPERLRDLLRVMQLVNKQSLYSDFWFGIWEKCLSTMLSSSVVL